MAAKQTISTKPNLTYPNLSAKQPHQFGTQVKILTTLTHGSAPEGLCIVALFL